MYPIGQRTRTLFDLQATSIILSGTTGLMELTKLTEGCQRDDPASSDPARSLHL